MHRLFACAGCAVVVVWLSGSRPAGQAPPAPPPSATAPAPGQEPAAIVPVHREPHHRQVFQHGPIRILDLQLPPGDISWFHTHEWPVLLLALESSQTRTQILGLDWGARLGGARAGAPGREGASGREGAGRGGAPVVPAEAAPRVPAGAGAAVPSVRPTSTTSYADAPVTHRLQNIGNGIARNIVVVNETQGDDTMSEQAAGFTAKPELSNKWFRAYRVVLSPGETTATHKHRTPVAIIQVTSGKGLGAGALRWDFNEPGQWAFFEAGDSHDFRNIGDVRLELIEVEVRGK